jgi:outer membrane protein assembly factor BamA
MDTSFSVGPATPSGTASHSTLRSTSLEGGVVFPILHARTLHSALASVIRARSDFTLPEGSLIRDRTAVRGAWQTITARSYGYSISPENGFAVGGTAEAVRRSFGSDADATTYSGDLRVYAPGVRPHDVVAVRVSGGMSNGDATVGRTFLLGGAAPAASLIDFGSRASSLLRGFPDATFAGTRVALANAEYRFPVYRLQRGFGTWPIFFHTFHGSVFADAGETWSSQFRLDALKASIGVEASADVVAAYFARLTIAAGAALGHDRSGAVRDGATLYLRIGKAF